MLLDLTEVINISFRCCPCDGSGGKTVGPPHARAAGKLLDVSIIVRTETDAPPHTLRMVLPSILVIQIVVPNNVVASSRLNFPAEIFNVLRFYAL